MQEAARYTVRTGETLRDAVIEVAAHENAILMEPGARVENVQVAFTAPTPAVWDPRVGCGLLAPEARDLVVADFYCTGHLGNGILLGRDGVDVRVEGVRLTRVRIEQGRCPDDPTRYHAFKDIQLYARRFRDVVLEHCHTQGLIGGGTDSGIALVHNAHLRGAYGRVMEDVTISGCSALYHRRHGILVAYANERCWNVVVRGNAGHYNGWMGLYVNAHHRTPDDGRWVLEQNACLHNGGGNGDYVDHPAATIRGGIVLVEVGDALVRGNVCRDNGTPARDATARHAAGIRARVPGRITIVGNDLRGNAAGPIAEWEPPAWTNADVRNNVTG